jgi:hypothetical protein
MLSDSDGFDVSRCTARVPHRLRDMQTVVFIDLTANISPQIMIFTKKDL